MAAIENKIVVTREYRPCLVNGKKALFHMWAETENVLLKINCFISSEEANKIMAEYKKRGYIPNGITTEKIKNLVALVEYEDGQVDEVQPSAVRFLDNECRNYAAFAEREDRPVFCPSCGSPSLSLEISSRDDFLQKTEKYRLVCRDCGRKTDTYKSITEAEEEWRAEK